MPGQDLLRDLILTYALALTFIVGLARVRIPPVVAMIAAGTVAGPSGIGLIRTQEDVDLLARIGIVLLLFTVGLDFSLTEIRRIWKTVTIGGALQIAGTTGVVMLLATPIWGASSRLGLLAGLFVALSSTAIVLKGLGERNQLGSPRGRLMVGVLLFQDLCLVLLLLLVPVLSGQTPFREAPLMLLRASLALAAVAVVSRLVLPPLIRAVTASGRREAFPLAILLASVGTAWLSSLVGVSMELGAFLGGLVLAESEFSHQAHAEIRPLRDILGSLFFISLGMIVEITLVARWLPTIAGLAGGIVVVKALVAAGAFYAAASPLRVAVAAAVGVAQVGEFSFILGKAGLDAGLLSPERWQALLGASILTMVATPLLLDAGPVLGAWLAGKSRRPDQRETPEGIPKLSDHVVVLGFGLGGQLAARALGEVGVPYLVLELNGATVGRARREGEPIFYGDATHPHSLRAAGIERARAVVAVLSDPEASLRMVKTVRRIAPAVPILVRARYQTEAESLLRLGATVAVAEEIETSLEVLAQLLARLNVAGNLIDAVLEIYRKESASLRPMRAPRPPLDSLPPPLRDAPIATHELAQADWSVGRTLGDINLRAETGATVLAVQSGSEYVTSPPPDLRLRAGDVLYLMGDDSVVLPARRKLTQG